MSTHAYIQAGVFVTVSSSDFCVLLHSLFVLSCCSTLVQVAALEACAKEKEKAEKQIEELMKTLAKFEKDIAVGAEVCNALSLLTVQYSSERCPLIT